MTAIDVSLVLVTHDRAQAERMAEFVLRLDGGRVEDEAGS